jgi:hypothetical protein
VLPANRVITLEARDRLELLDGAGTHVLVGPGRSIAGRIDDHVRVRMIDLFPKKSGADVSGIAGARSLSDEDANKLNLWQVDASEGGDVCLPSGQSPTLTRHGDLTPMSLTIWRAASKESAIVHWPTGVSRMPWPTNLPVADGEMYKLNNDDRSVVVQWRNVTSRPAGLADLAAEFSDKGCVNQLAEIEAAVELNSEHPVP